MEVAEQTLGRWVKTYRDQVGEVEPISESERAELQRLRKEKREWELDRAFLKKRQSSSPRKPRICQSVVQIDWRVKKNFSVSRMARLLGVSRSELFCVDETRTLKTPG